MATDQRIQLPFFSLRDFLIDSSIHMDSGERERVAGVCVSVTRKGEQTNEL